MGMEVGVGNAGGRVVESGQYLFFEFSLAVPDLYSTAGWLPRKWSAQGHL